MRGISPKAVLLATLAVFGIDTISIVIITGIFAPPLGNLNDEQIKAVYQALNHDRGYLTAAIVLGTASTVIGGYLAARLAPTLPYYNALAFGLLGILLGALIPADVPAWFNVIAFGLTIPAAVLGGHLWKRQKDSPPA